MPPDAPSMLLEDQLCFALYVASRKVQGLYRARLRSLGLTYPQFLVLLVLWEKGPLGVSELGEPLDLDSATLTPLLKRMESAGFLTRQRDAQDERRLLISLTDSGQAVRAQVEALVSDVTCAAHGATSEPGALLQALRTLSQQLPDHVEG